MTVVLLAKKMAQRHLDIVLLFLCLVIQTNGVVNEVGKTVKDLLCDNQTRFIACKDGGTLRIERGEYGRRDQSVCPAQPSNDLCEPKDVLNEIRTACEGKTHCIVRTSRDILGNPCPHSSKYLEFTYTCLPQGVETCGKFPKCHPSAVCVDNDHCECKDNLQGDGITGCYPTCTCLAHGDPHFKTFDGTNVDFMGACKYTLSRYNKAEDHCSYAVELKTEHRGGSTSVSYTRLIDVKVFGKVIRLHRHKRIFVNGKEVFLPYRTEEFEIYISGTYVRLETRCGLVVQYDGEQNADVRVPNAYGNDLTGMCGNCNNNPNDDSKDFTAFEVADDSDLVLEHCKKPQDFHPCARNPTYKTEGETTSVCRVMNPASTKQSAFSECFKSVKEEAALLFSSCVYDYCVFRLDNKEGRALEKVLCEDVSALADMCAFKGITVKWRTPTVCPLPCGPNSHYSAEMTACPATCVDREAPSKCTRNVVEGCECDTGYVLSNQRCVRVTECGCTDDDGHYYPDGTEFVSDDCSIVRQCTSVGNEMKIVVKETRDPCGTNAECNLEDGQYTCLCKARHTGDPLKGCTEITCGDNSHYVKQVTACPATCQDPRAPSKCRKPMSEGCTCDNGFVMNEGQCIRVQECGCIDEDGTRYQDGSEFVSSDCSEVKQCTAVGNEMKIVVKETRDSCGTNAECKLQDGQYTCVCMPRHTGDPLKGCTAPLECRMKFDGSDYEGAVSETVTGKQCRTWNTLSSHRYAKLGAHNGCRNPYPRRKIKAPWCFINDGKAWEYCDIPMCKAKKPHCIAQTTISCSSAKGQSRRCTKPAIKYTTWVSKTNDPKCVFGLSYGRQKNAVWVNGECGGIFDVCYIPENISYKPQPAPATECKRTRKGTDYKGTWGITASGRLCQSWASQHPQANKFARKLSGQANYCRNPNPVVRKRPWCFVDDPRSKTKWEYCEILYC